MRTALSLSNVSPPHVCWGFSGCASYTLLAALHCICGSSDVQVYHPLGKVSVTSVCWQVCQKHATCCGFRHFCGICQRRWIKTEKLATTMVEVCAPCGSFAFTHLLAFPFTVVWVSQGTPTREDITPRGPFQESVRDESGVRLSCF